MNKDLIFNNLTKRYENTMMNGFKRDGRSHLIVVTEKEYDFMKAELMKKESKIYGNNNIKN